MLNQLTAAWRARRVLLIGSPDAQNLYTEALLAALGARAARIPPDSRADTLSRALVSGRISAVIVPSAHALTDNGDLFAQLRALDLILREIREAGVPLCILCSHENVYAPDASSWQAEEGAPLGGRTKEGLIQSILQLYADGVSRALMGDAVRTIICRHAPCLGGGHQSVRQYGEWCRALLREETPVVESPGAQGTFLHPLDAALGALCLGARALQGETDCTGSFNVAPGPENLCANRSSFALLAASEGCARAPRESYPQRMESLTPLSGEKLRRLCGFSPLLSAKEALAFYMELERARAVGEAAAQIKRTEQAEYFLQRLKA